MASSATSTTDTTNLYGLVFQNQAVQSQSQELRSVAGVSAYIKRNFCSLDYDGDGHIGRTDVLRMIAKPEMKREDALASAFLYHYRGNLGTTEMSLELNDFDRLTDPRYRDKAQRTLDQLAKKEDVQANVYPKNRIDPTMIVQGAVADVNFAAALVALAATPSGDKRIRKMIESNEDNSYTVTFPGDPNHPIKVKETTLQEKMVGSCSTDGSQFVTLLEKAYGIHQQIMRITQQRWGIVRDAFELLTGSQSQSISLQRNNPLSTEASDMRNRQAILQALKNYKTITLRIGEGECAETSGYVSHRRVAERQARGLTLKSAHAYALVDYNESTRMVTICDASKSAIKDRSGFIQGEINIQLSELERCFSEINIEV